MNAEFQEPVRKKVAGSLSNIPFQRLEMLRRNSLFLPGGKWRPPADDGTLVRKMADWPTDRPPHSPESSAKLPEDRGT